ncbi:MAG: metallophosphoesterase [Deltaproteobacteria bacterium]|nr:metallophosphoesterase [Deltaproteobacteria bacterium]
MDAERLPSQGSPRHTIVVSDLHLAEAEPSHPGNPLWKRYKRRSHFVDKSFKRFLEHLREAAHGPLELVFNGDVFDFDATMALPERPPFGVSWLERHRGLTAQQAKSRYKLSVILEDHPVWVRAVRDWVLDGHRVVFVIGNHDLELHWPAVRDELMRWLALPDDAAERVRVCEWFYVSSGDTLIEHGNQYDPYCVCPSPIHPVVRKRGGEYVRLPFGNLAARFMLNGMGLFNPHVDSSFIKASFFEYVKFFYQYLMRIQPLLGWTWFWSSIVTFLLRARGGGAATGQARAARLRGPRREIAARANATPRVVRSLARLHAHPAVLSPLKVMRELWLDRALLVVAALLFSFELTLLAKLFVQVPLTSFVAPFAVLMPWVIRYARGVESENAEAQKGALEKLDLSSQIAGVNRVVHGHTHHQMHRWIGDVELINTGTWSPAFHDVECTQPFGLKCFAWIRPGEPGEARHATLFEWADPGIRALAVERLPMPADEPRTRLLPTRKGRQGAEAFAGAAPALEPAAAAAISLASNAAGRTAKRAAHSRLGLTALLRAVLP